MANGFEFTMERLPELDFGRVQEPIEQEKSLKITSNI